MKVNYHTHTYRCGHAKGSEREYIERAIENGITHMGFSDHIPFIFPDGYETKHRVPMSSAQEYMDTLRALREEYKEKIDISIGFEMEYYPLYFADMLKLACDLGAEYLILGQHYFFNEIPEKIRTGKSTDSEELLESYVSSVTEAMESGVFSYVAHPDVINYVGDEQIYLKHMKRICETSKKCGVPLEINFLGIRDDRNYPTDVFWKMVGEEGCEVVFGFDAHDVLSSYDGESLKTAEGLVEKYGLKLNRYPVLIDPKTPKTKERKA